MNTDAEILGNAYEYLIGQFASETGKKAGEFYTPQAVSKILTRIAIAWDRKIRGDYPYMIHVWGQVLFC